MRELKSHNRFPVQPWLKPLHQRLIQLNEYHKAGYSINLFLYEKPDSSTFRYRVYNIVQALEKSAKFRAVYFFEEEINQIQDLAILCQIITVVRFRWTFELENLLVQASLNQIPILFDSDDLVFDLAHIPALVNIQNIDQRTDHELNYWFSYVSRMNLTARLADAITTTNGHLATYLQASFGRPVHVIRNFMNREQISYSAQCVDEKSRTDNRDPFTIGYFSGSPSHYFDLHCIADELCDLLDEFSDIQILVVGYMDFAPRLKAYFDRGRIRFHKFVDFLTLQRLIAEVDVNIAPLYPNDFTESKSELKFFEAALVKTVTCASPTFTFREAIRHEENGYLCRQGEWYKTIRSIYLNRDGQEKLLNNAQETALARYSAQANLPVIEMTYQAIVDMVKS